MKKCSKNSCCLFLLAMVIFSSCNNKSNKSIKLFSAFKHDEKIETKDLYEFKEGQVGNIQVNDSNLILLNVAQGAKSHLCAYNLSQGTVVHNFLHKGKGPNEGLAIINIGIEGGYLWAQDITLRKIFQIRLNEIREPQKMKIHGYDDRYYFIDFLDENHYSGTLMNSTTSIPIVNILSNKVEKKIIRDPWFSPEYADGYKSLIFMNKQKGKLALAYRFVDAVEIYNLDDGSSKISRGPEGFECQGDIVHNRWIVNQETKIAYTGGVSTSEYIYLLYSGGKAMSSREAFDGSCIFIFDWNGNPIRKLETGYRIGAIGVAEDGKTIYLYNSNSGFITTTNI